MDRISPNARSLLMAAVRPKDTTPEIRVRKVLHAMGVRFRLHRTDLPGSPDVVLPSRRVVIFVHGCFWHRHRRCSKATTPKANRSFWIEKFVANTKRDSKAAKALSKMRWKVITIWECETKDPITLEKTLRESLELVLF